MVIFLPAYQLLSKKYTESQIFKWIFYPSFIFKFFISLASVIMYLFNISIFIIGDNNVLYYAGVRYVELESKKFTLLLYGLYSDPNYAAVYSLTFLFLGFFLWYKVGLKTKVEKVCLSIFIIVELTLFSLSNSRGAELAFYTSVIFYVILMIVKMIFHKEQSKLARRTIFKLGAFSLIFMTLIQALKFSSFVALEQNNPTKILIINKTNTFLKLNDTSEKEILKQYVDNLNEISLNLNQIKKLLNQGYYNGHLPITGIISFVSLVVAYLYGYDATITSLEKSADEGNTFYHGLEINHQRSKSSEFEQDFQNYVHQRISEDFSSYSLLRKRYEIRIIQEFCKYPKYFYNFSSCNRNFHQS